MPGFTPMRVRGKRSATDGEKWHAGKKRRHDIQSPASATLGTNAKASDIADPSRQSRKRRTRDLSMLEQLPTEVLETIFLHSENVDLPLASLRLSTQLASVHSHHQLTSLVLRPILGRSEFGYGGRSDCSAALRLMNSKFFTWSFCKTWLRAEFNNLNLQESYRAATAELSTSEPESIPRETWTWKALNPLPSLPPPKKLMRRPFTADSLQFLQLTLSTLEDRILLDAGYIDNVCEGLSEAVADGASNMLEYFWMFDITPSMDILRDAVIQYGCDKNMVANLVGRLQSDTTLADFLDPDIWSWADKARRSGDEKGQWLMNLLREAASKVDHANAGKRGVGHTK